MAAAQFVVWGYKPGALPEPYPIRLSGGNVRTCRADQRDWTAQGWTTGIYKRGDTPAGLRDRVYAEHGRPSADFLAAIGQPVREVADCPDCHRSFPARAGTVPWHLRLGTGQSCGPTPRVDPLALLEVA